MKAAPPLLSLTLYRTLLWLLTPYLRWRFWREGRRYRDNSYSSQRRGRGHPRFEERPVWFHAASVGEVNALMPLLETLHRERPGLPLLLTSNTASSGAIARSRLPAGVVHAYLPMDWRGAMGRFLAQCQPRLGIIMETELWPNLYQLCSEGKTPLIIINGRVSTRTLRAPRWLRQLYRDCLRRTRLVLARSAEDRDNFLTLGATSAQCRVVGNIKFAVLTGEAPAPIDLGRDYVLAASTRDGEELLIIKAWLATGREELLVIAPRHPQRLDTILRDLAPFQLSTKIRSRGESPNATTRLYLADTLGELRAFMAGAKVVFMGGSLVATGGQNILEPAALGKAVITGPHLENFSHEAHLLLQGKGVIQVTSVEGLSQAFTTLLEDETERHALGQRARATVAQHADMVERYLQVLREYL
ncbi:MAG: 3-deoxy-D-manno-octulosonic acid transferase [Gammaproteobacteria bacterium]|nr:3-deoxy-D-manno-octulosonic acid transferase [Gammaproteobacteria bacterium]